MVVPINNITTKAMWLILVSIKSYNIIIPIAITLGGKPNLDYMNESMNELMLLYNTVFTYNEHHVHKKIPKLGLFPLNVNSLNVF